ncbi:MAG: SRPBCC family protein [Candidatus Acidiferrum sp.]
MTERFAKGTSTCVSKIIKAPRKAIYQAFLDPDSVASWLSPDNMKGQVHAFDAREGGIFRMSLTYLDPQHSLGGKTSEDTDTFQGRFVELVPYSKIVEVVEFESQDPAFAGEMRLTVSLADVDGGTEVTILCQDIPIGIRPEDNELGCRESLQKLAALMSVLTAKPSI